MSVFSAFYVSRGTFWGRNCLNELFFSHFFSSRKFFIFLGKFFRQGCHVSNLCDWRRFLMKCVFWENWFFIQLFSKIERKAFDFLSSFLAALLNLHSLCAEEHSAEKFSFHKKSTFFSDFDPKKLDSEKQLGMFVKTVPT